jgi:hypothetical protein
MSKSAMQEHFEWLQENQLYFGIPIEAIDNAEDLLQKEKEQIEIAFDLGRDEVTSVFIIDGEDYYNKKFNQNK